MLYIQNYKPDTLIEKRELANIKLLVYNISPS